MAAARDAEKGGLAGHKTPFGTKDMSFHDRARDQRRDRIDLAKLSAATWTRTNSTAAVLHL